MKAVVCSGYGPPDRLEIREVERPSPADDEVLVRVRSTTVNRTDAATMRGIPWFARIVTGVRGPKHEVLGTEFAGRVEAVGPQVGAFEVGQDVFGFSEAGSGAHAQYLTMPAAGAITTVPDGMSHHDAAPTTEGAHYALSCLATVELAPGDDVLVYGASGAIGTAAVQLLAHRGVRVTAVCDPRGVEVVRSLGADVVVDRTTGDASRFGRRYVAVIDAVGKSSLEAWRPLLAPGAPYLTTDLGPRGRNLVLIPWTRIVGGHRVRLPMPRDTRGHVLEVRSRLEGGHLRPVIDRTYPLERIAEAYRYVETGQKLGTVVIDVP